MQDLTQTRLLPLMALSAGHPEVGIGLIDGPVALAHAALRGARWRQIGEAAAACSQAGSQACQHGTFVAGLLVGQGHGERRGISPGCTLLIRRLFAEAPIGSGRPVTSATPHQLVEAIDDGVRAGARVLNISAAWLGATPAADRSLHDALDQAARQGVLVVCAAGNQSALSSTALTRHPWVIPVVAMAAPGRPWRQSNVSGVVGRHGLAAPGERITSLASEGGSLTSDGTSAAAPFVTGAIALLCSLFPHASANDIRYAVVHGGGMARKGVVPPMLDAMAAYQHLATRMRGSILPHAVALARA